MSFRFWGLIPSRAKDMYLSSRIRRRVFLWPALILILSLFLLSFLTHPMVSLAGEAADDCQLIRDMRNQPGGRIQDTGNRDTDTAQDTGDSDTDTVQDIANRDTDKAQDTGNRDTDKAQDTGDRFGDIVRDAVDRFNDRIQESFEVLSELRAQELARQQAQADFNRNVGAYLTLVNRISEETPWLIRVNQSTCVVTIYRVMEVSPGDDISKTALADLVRRGIVLGEGEWVDAIRNTPALSDDGSQISVSGDIESGSIVSGDGASENSDSDDGTSESSDLDDVIAEIVPDTVTVWLPVYACPCSTGAPGSETPTGIFYIQDHLRWHELVGPTWGQWCCHFAPSYLFHSLPYERPNDPNSLQADVYNLIGQGVSHGCVRLTCVDAKYIYDHVPTGGKVEVFYGTEADDLFGKPQRPYVGEWDKAYDPTDPEYRPE